MWAKRATFTMWTKIHIKIPKMANLKTEVCCQLKIWEILADFRTLWVKAAFIDWHKLKIYVALIPKLSQKISSWLALLDFFNKNDTWVVTSKKEASPYLCEQWTHSSLAFTFLVNHLVTFNALKDFSNILARERPFSSYHCVHKAIRHSSHSKAQHCTFFQNWEDDEFSYFPEFCKTGVTN